MKWGFLLTVHKHKMKRIAIQGFEGCFHEMAAKRYFNGENLSLLYCNTFEQVFDKVKDTDDTIGIVAIENTIAGSLLHNYELLCQSGLEVVGEKKLHISHSICCLPDDTWETIHEVHSHPVALMQCRKYLERHPVLKSVEADDTAGAAMNIAKNKLHGQAAICNAEAARKFGMKILEEHIEDNKHNYTRFLIITPKNKANELKSLNPTDKASLAFTISHECGSLAKVLSIFSFYGINLTKIQSLPIIGREWEYRFYIDLSFSDYTQYKQSIEAVKPLTSEFINLGEYNDDKN